MRFWESNKVAMREPHVIVRQLAPRFRKGTKKERNQISRRSRGAMIRSKCCHLFYIIGDCRCGGKSAPGAEAIAETPDIHGRRTAMKNIFLVALSVVVLIVLAGVAGAQESRIELRTHQSTILGTSKNFNIFLPDGYDSDSLRYPVLYLFRGHEREWANPVEDASRRGNIKTVVDRLTATGAIGKMILVMPGLSQPGTASDFAYVADELIPYIDANFRTVPVRQKRGMDGFSYGGYDMLQLLRRSPELFYTAGAYDGSFWVVDLNTFFSTATEAYWNLLRPMKFLIHSTVAGNYASNLQFLSILNSHGIRNGFDSLNLAQGAAHNWYYADLHMEQSLPLHWRHFLEGADSLAVRITSPIPGMMLSGTVPVQWSMYPHVSSVQTTVDYSRDRGVTWNQLYSSSNPDTVFSWNTAPVQDGTRYMLRVRVLGDTVYGFVQMAGRFTINNPGNAQPEVEILSPDSLQILSGTQPIVWWAEDADGDSLAISIDASIDNGLAWNHLANPAGTGAYLWNTAAYPNSPTYRLRIRAGDTRDSGVVVSPPFAVSNPRAALHASLVEHVAGAADGTISVHVVDSLKMTGHRYRIVFHDSVPASKTYSVTDRTTGTTVLTGAPVGRALQEGPFFDGLRLVLDDIDPPRLSADSTRWLRGVSNLLPAVTLPSFDPGTGLITGVPYAADYSIEVYDHAVDTSSSLFGWPAVPMNFTVWNVTESRKIEVFFTDLDGDRRIGQYDDLIFIERDSLGNPFLTWELYFSTPAQPILPSPGDFFLFKVLKPFTSRDVYEFVASPGGLVSVPPDVVSSAFQLEQNYPNPFNAATVIRYTIPEGPVYDQTGVSGLPVARDVRLAVYDLLGREVAVLVEEKQAPGSYAVTWAARGMASGIYFYRMQAGNFVQTRRSLLLK